MSGECARKPYPEAAARARGEQTGKGPFRCAWCGNWHVGQDPGPVAPCWRCGTLVTIPERGIPLDAARGWLHDPRRCQMTGAA